MLIRLPIAAVLLALAALIVPSPAAPSDRAASAPTSRVLIIGDAISIGYTPVVADDLEGIAGVTHNPDNALDSGNGLARLDDWLGTTRWDVIYFNFGLQDLKRDNAGQIMTPPEVYQANLRKIVARLKQTGARIIWGTTTPIPDGGLHNNRHKGDEVIYNRIAAGVMEENDIAVDDLYGAAIDHLADYQNKDDLHFNDAGCKALGDHVSVAVKQALTLPTTRGSDDK